MTLLYVMLDNQLIEQDHGSLYNMMYLGARKQKANPKVSVYLRTDLLNSVTHWKKYRFKKPDVGVTKRYLDITDDQVPNTLKTYLLLGA